MSRKLRASLHATPEIVTPEMKVCRAVLGQAYEDAELPLLVDGSEPFFRAKARAFLRGDTPADDEMLEQICGSAQVPMDRVVAWARKRYPLAVGSTGTSAGAPLQSEQAQHDAGCSSGPSLRA